MKIKTAIKILLLSILFLPFLLTDSNAQEYIHIDDFEVNVTANINVDLYTQLSLLPQTVEIMQPSAVNILAIDSNGVPRPDRQIVIYIDGYSTGTTIIQPNITDLAGQTTGAVFSSIPGTYTVCAKDITEGYDILIEDCEQLYVVPVPPPNLFPEPQYTEGTTNSIMWNTLGSGIYQFYAEVSRNVSFLPVENNSSWISNYTHQFTNLQQNIMYFYRVKARNTYGGESAWSNTVFSVQDATPPIIELISISDIGENTTTNWDPDYSINIRYRIRDNSAVASREFWCQTPERDDCIHTASVSGDIWNISIKLRNLKNDNHVYLFNQYTFCVEATDIVNNVARNCEAILTIEDEIPGEEEPTEPVLPPAPKPTPPVTSIIRKRIDDLLDSTIGQLEPTRLQDITITATATNVTIGFGLLISLLGHIPYFLLQLILAILSLLGFRKKGNVSGYVYDSVTKEPVPQAIVRVFNENNELVWTDVTNSNGYFHGSELPDAEYTIKVTARRYKFPSKIVFGKTDFPLENIYHGQKFLTREGKIPTYSIPMDKEETNNIEKAVAMIIFRTKAIWKSLHIILFLLGFLFSIYALYKTEFWWNYLIVSLYIPAFIALLLSMFTKKDKYGIVLDDGGKPVSGAILSLKEKEFGKMVTKRVSDGNGRYRFFVEKGDYQIEIMNSDMKITSPEKITNIQVKKTGGTLVVPILRVKKLEDKAKDTPIIEPPEEL